ncbi:MAG: sigma-70 family RNA polymerase sigma factor [Verrucomicrobiota bacterium]
MSASNAFPDAPTLPALSRERAEATGVTPRTAVRWFHEEVHPHEPALKSYLRGSFPTVRDVEDVVQESYLRFWRMRAVGPIRSARALLFKVARHVAIDVLRHRRASPIAAVPNLAEVPVMDPARSAFDVAALNDEVALLAEALETLPPRCREIVVLRKFQHLSQKEVAAQLGIAEETVQEQVYRGLRKCETFLVRRGIVRPWTA